MNVILRSVTALKYVELIHKYANLKERQRTLIKERCKEADAKKIVDFETNITEPKIRDVVKILNILGGKFGRLRIIMSILDMSNDELQSLKSDLDLMQNRLHPYTFSGSIVDHMTQKTRKHFGRLYRRTVRFSSAWLKRASEYFVYASWIKPILCFLIIALKIGVEAYNGEGTSTGGALVPIFGKTFTSFIAGFVDFVKQAHQFGFPYILKTIYINIAKLWSSIHDLFQVTKTSGKFMAAFEVISALGQWLASALQAPDSFNQNLANSSNYGWMAIGAVMPIELAYRVARLFSDAVCFIIEPFNTSITAMDIAKLSCEVGCMSGMMLWCTMPDAIMNRLVKFICGPMLGLGNVGAQPASNVTIYCLRMGDAARRIVYVFRILLTLLNASMILWESAGLIATYMNAERNVNFNIETICLGNSKVPKAGTENKKGHMFGTWQQQLFGQLGDSRAEPTSDAMRLGSDYIEKQADALVEAVWNGNAAPLQRELANSAGRQIAQNTAETITAVPSALRHVTKLGTGILQGSLQGIRQMF